LIDLESGQYAAYARTLSVSRRASLPPRGVVPMNKKAAAQSRTPPDAGLRVQRSILPKASAGQCLPRLPKPGEPQRKFYEPPLVISRQSTAILL
jgi:hypothetical protein